MNEYWDVDVCVFHLGWVTLVNVTTENTQRDFVYSRSGNLVPLCVTTEFLYWPTQPFKHTNHPQPKVEADEDKSIG